MTSTVVDGRRVWLRLLEPSDANLIRLFYWRLSRETVYRRFLSLVKPPANVLVRTLVDVDHHDRDALIALDERGIVGVARYGRSSSGGGHDVAVVVADDWQRHGLGSLLMKRLANIARLRGISSFHATMFADNRAAQSLVLGLSRNATMRYEGGYLEADIPLRPTA